jgi:type IV pilus assembly protein PilV
MMRKTTARQPKLPKRQHGIMLLEGLIAILIFSLGILATIGMQAISVSQLSQSKYRTDASFLANKLIAQIWADQPANRLLYATGGARFNTWKANEFDAYMPPGSSTATVNIATYAATRLTTTGAPAVTAYRVNITIQWRAPNEPLTAPIHSYTTTNDII